METNWYRVRGSHRTERQIKRSVSAIVYVNLIVDIEMDKWKRLQELQDTVSRKIAEAAIKRNKSVFNGK